MHNYQRCIVDAFVVDDNELTTYDTHALNALIEVHQE